MRVIVVLKVVGQVFLYGRPYLYGGYQLGSGSVIYLVLF